MRRALIGHTGFVGGALAARGHWDARLNSRTIGQIVGERFDEVVCAGVPAVKWLANQKPEEDRAAIATLTDALERAHIARFVLISTIDVYPDPAAPVDEDFDPAGAPNHAYGLHRLALEQWIAARFSDHLIVRLPALFGEGLKKNVLFDLLHNHQTESINPASVFQWYPTARLSGDLAVAARARLRLVNLFTEPLPTRAILARHFPDTRAGPETQPAPRYDLRTRHGALFGGDGRYAMRAADVLSEMDAFIARERSR